MELLQLKYLCTAARLENFSRAARHHNIPQSAISKTILQLERELGVQLFIRTGNRVSLSETGRVFCREVQRSLDILNEAADRAKAGHGGCTGHVSVLLGAHRDEVLSLLAAFRRENPAVTLAVDTVLAPGKHYDLAITPRAYAPGSTVRDLRGEEILLLVPTNHRLATAERVALAELQGERVIALNAPALSPLLERLPERPVITCDDLHSLAAYVATGSGVALAPGFSLQRARELGVTLVHLRDSAGRYPTCISYGEEPAPAARALLSWLTARLGKSGK